jgi:hypothetical protein
MNWEGCKRKPAENLFREVTKSFPGHAFELWTYHLQDGSQLSWLVKCALKYVRNVLLPTECIKKFRNGILHVQCTAHNSVILF